MLADPLVHTLIAAADQKDLFEAGQFPRDCLIERPALRGKKDDRLLRGVAFGLFDNVEAVRAVEDRSRLENHAFPTAERAIIHGAVPVVSETTKIVRMHGESAGDDSPTQNPVLEGSAEEAWKDCKYIEAHGLAEGQELPSGVGPTDAVV